MNEDMASDFHAHSAKGLFFCKRGRPDTQTAMAFLTVQVKEPDQDDWKKLSRKMAHSKGTKDMVLTLEADDLRLVRWHIDASFAAHDDMCLSLNIPASKIGDISTYMSRCFNAGAQHIIALRMFNYFSDANGAPYCNRHV